jgi:hypothetical protein
MIFYFNQYGVQGSSLKTRQLPFGDRAIRKAVSAAHAVLVANDNTGFTIQGSMWHARASRLVWAKSPSPAHDFMTRYKPRIWYISAWTKAEVAAVWWASPCVGRLSNLSISHLANMTPNDVVEKARVAGLIPRAILDPATTVQSLESALERARLVISSWDQPDQLLVAAGGHEGPKVCLAPSWTFFSWHRFRAIPPNRPSSFCRLAPRRPFWTTLVGGRQQRSVDGSGRSSPILCLPAWPAG